MSALGAHGLSEGEIHDQPANKAAVQVCVAKHATTFHAGARHAQVDWQPARLALREKIRPAENPEWL